MKKEQQNSTELIRVNSIIDMPSAINDLYNLSNENLLAVARTENSIEIWNTKTWIQLLKIPGLKSGFWDFDLTNDNQHCLLACDDGTPRLIKLDQHDLYLVKQYAKTDSKILSVSYEYPSQNYFYTGHSNGYIIKWDSKTGEQILNFNMISNKLEKKNKNSDNLIWCVKSINEKYLASSDSTGCLKIWDSSFGILIKEFYEHKADLTTIEINRDFLTLYFTGSDSLVCSVQYQEGEWNLTSKFRGQSHDISKICLLNSEYLLSGGVTTDICIYKLVNSRLIEKYEKKVNTNVKRHISAFEQKSKIYIGQSENKENIFILHRKLNLLDLWLINIDNEEKSILLARINKNEDSNIISANISRNGKYICYSDTDNTCLFQYNFEENLLKKLKTLKNISGRYVYFSADESKLIIVNQNKTKIIIYNITKQTFIDIDFDMDKNDSILACDFFSSEQNKNFNKLELVQNENKTPKKNTSNSKKNSTLKKTEEKFKENNSDKTEKKNFEYLVFSTVNKNLFFFNLDENNFFSNQNLPHPDSYVTQVKFFDKKSLILTCEDNKFYLLNFEIFIGVNKENYEKMMDVEFKFDEWTNKNINNFPINYLKWYNKIVGIAPDVKNKNLFLLYTDYNYILVDLEKEIPQYSKIEKIKAEKFRNSDWTMSIKDYHKKIFDKNYKNVEIEDGDYNEFKTYLNKNFGKINENELNLNELENENFKIVSRFSSILFMNYLDHNENKEENFNKSVLLVVENDWNKITKNFSETVTRNNYGH